MGQSSADARVRDRPSPPERTALHVVPGAPVEPTPSSGGAPGGLRAPGGRSGRRPLLLRNGPFARVFAGTTTSLLGTAIAAVSLPLIAVVRLDASPLVVGVIEAAVWTPWLVVGLPAGAWADRYPPRRLIVAADLFSAALYAAVPVLAVLDVLGLWYLVALALVAGTSEVVSQAALGVLPPVLVDDEDLESANAVLQAAESGTDLFGPLGSSVLTRLLGLTAGLAANAVSFVVCAVCVATTPATGRRIAAAPARGSLAREIREGLRELFGHPLLRRLALTGAVVNTALTGLSVLHALFLIRDLDVGAAAVGLLLVGQGVCGLLGAALAPRIARRVGATAALGAIAAVTFPVVLLVPLATRGWGLSLFVVGTAVPMAGVMAANVLTRTLRQRIATPGLLGRVAAGSRALAYSTSPVAALLGGVIAALIGVRLSYVVFGALLVLAAASFVLRPLRDPATA